MRLFTLISAFMFAGAACSESDEAADQTALTSVQEPAAHVAADSGDDRTTRNPALTELGPLYVSANLDNGRRLWQRCSTCHSLDGSAAPLPGPTLQNILGRPVGEQAGYAYSDALRDAEFIWTADRLDAWLASPDDFLEGNAMSFAGVSDPDDRRDLIACIALGRACLDGAP